jgi:hypothetical protein
MFFTLDNYTCTVTNRTTRFIRFIFINHIFFSDFQLFGLSTTDETSLVEMRIWCIKIGIVLVLHSWKLSITYGKFKFIDKDWNKSLDTKSALFLYLSIFINFLERSVTYGPHYRWRVMQRRNYYNLRHLFSLVYDPVSLIESMFIFHSL